MRLVPNIGWEVEERFVEREGVAGQGPRAVALAGESDWHSPALGACRFHPGHGSGAQRSLGLPKSLSSQVAP